MVRSLADRTFQLRPAGLPVLAVGGVDEGNVAAWWASGARGFGVGGALFRPGVPPAQVRANAEAFVEAVEVRR